jgi:ribonuclease HI
MTPKGNIVLQHVSDLINPIDGQWDSALIESIFWPVDAHRILQIPLSPDREDLVAWHYNKIGLFTVRSAYYRQWDYRFGRKERNQNIAQSASNPVWKKLWNLEVPSKIKIFGWRVLHGIIPCRGVLANRHIGNQGGCPICSLQCEDIKHMLFKCTRAEDIWRKLGIREKLYEDIEADRSGSVVIQDIIMRGGRLNELNAIGVSELVLTAGWYIWWERRQITHGESVQTTPRSAMSILAMTTNYMKSNRKEKEAKKEGWKKPMEGKLMINIDAAFDIDSGRGAAGVIIRDYMGHFVAAAQVFLPHVVDAHMAEAYAFREGLTLAQRIGANNFIIQTDCAQVVETMKQGGFSATASAAIYDDCIILRSGFGVVSVEFCNREANHVAHELARVSFSLDSSCTWVDEPPSFILSKFVNDVTIV